MKVKVKDSEGFRPIDVILSFDNENDLKAFAQLMGERSVSTVFHHERVSYLTKGERYYVENDDMHLGKPAKRGTGVGN